METIKTKNQLPHSSSLSQEGTTQYPTKSPLIRETGRRAFTLVELIIVITILAILATIAFVSFQGYSAQSRDSNRVASVKNIENGVNIFFTKTGKVPDPDDLIGTGVLNTVSLNYVGKVGKNIARAINLNEMPLDPRAQEQYWYGVDILKRYFQVGLTLESETAYRPGIAPSYAGNILEAKVQGNYQYPLKIGSTLYSLPSLLFLGSGALTSTSAFIVDNGNNVPYTFGGQATGTQSVAEVLKIITGTGNLSLTGIVIPSMTSSDYKTATGIPDSFSGVASFLGITDKTKLGVAVYGNDYISGNGGSTSGGVGANGEPAYNDCTFLGSLVTHNTNVTAYQTSSVSYGNTCISEQRFCNNGVLGGTFTFSGCTVAGATGTFNLSQTTVKKGTSVTISNNCSEGPTSYTSSNTSVATVSGINITTLGGGTTNITPVGGVCGDNNAKILTVNSCNESTKPTDNGHITFAIGTPTEINQSYVQNASNCGYSCINGYTGTNCEIEPISSSCNKTQSITYTQAINNKATILGNISSYIGCEINDYPGTSIPGGGVYIAGKTNSNASIMVIAKSDSGFSKWKTSATRTSGTYSITDGLANTDAMVTAGISNHPAGQSCRNIGTNWYLPAKDELNIIYVNKSILRTSI